MIEIADAKKIVNISEKVISRWHKKENGMASPDDASAVISENIYDDIPACIEALSKINTALWHEEDKARDAGADDSVIAGVKRKIDALNAARADKVEEIDSIIYNRINFDINTPLNTETPGSVIDRLTILCLKKYHMKLEAERNDAPEVHRIKCSEWLSAISKQIEDLSSAYDILLEETAEGKRRYGICRQFKMYNNPELNPVLYGQKNK